MAGLTEGTAQELVPIEFEDLVTVAELLPFCALIHLYPSLIYGPPEEVPVHHMTLILSVFLFLTATSTLSAQVTTATLYGVVRDSTASSLPGALVSVTNQGTGFSREAVTDVSGEFAFTALPSGRYTLRIELQGFKTYTNDALELLAGQTV